jgi:hypothetical protein
MKIGLSRSHMVDGVTLYVFPERVSDPMDFASHKVVVREFFVKNGKRMLGQERVYLYVTGLTPLLTAFLNVWDKWGRKMCRDDAQLTLMHYNTNTGEYEGESWGAKATTNKGTSIDESEQEEGG